MEQGEQFGKIEKTKKVIKTSTGLIVILGAVVLFFGGALTYWYYNDPNNYGSSTDATVIANVSNSNTNSTNSNVNVNANSNSAVSSTTLTYANASYGLSFTYPNDWTKKEYAESNYAYFNSPETQAVLDKLIRTQAATEGPIPNFAISYFADLNASDGNNPKKYNTFADLVQDDAYYSSMKPTTLGGKSAYAGLESGMVGTYVIVAEVNNHIYKLNFNCETADQLSIAQKSIISSFQFTE